MDASASGVVATETRMLDDSRIGTRTDALVFLTTLALLVVGSLLIQSARFAPYWSWLVMIPGSVLGFAILERAKGHRWKTSVMRSLFGCCAFGLSGLVGYFINSTWGPYRFGSWESVVMLGLWAAMTAGIYRMEIVLAMRLRRRGRARR